jgi:voltage-gated potassium channel
MKQFKNSKIQTAVYGLLLIFIGGVLGFKAFYEYTWVDALYMTVITITTVGFGEVHPMSASEKIYTSVLIVSSIFIVGYSIKVVSEYLLSQTNIGNLRPKKVQEKIDKLSGHVIVCGYGRNGMQATQKLEAYKKSYVVVEHNEEIVERLYEHNQLAVLGNANDDEVLIKAGVERASSLISALPSDADNLFVVLSARQINKDLKIISRASEDTSYKKLKLAGADNVILPDKIGGDHMASLVVVPDLVEFLDNLTVSGDQDSYYVEQVPFDKVCPDGRAQQIRELDLRKKTGCSIIGYKSRSGEYIVNPEADMVLEPGSKLILIGRPDQIENLKQHYRV